MKLSLSFNGAQTTLAFFSSVIAEAGANTSFSMNTAQAWNATDLTTLCQAAGSKSLSLDFNGAQSTDALMASVLGAAGANTSISMNTSQVWFPANLTALCQAAGAKKLSLAFDGAGSTEALMTSVIGATGTNTTVSMNSSHTWYAANLTALCQAAGAKKLSLAFDGAGTIPTLLSPAIGAAGINTSISMNNSQTWSTVNLTALCQSAGTKMLKLDFVGTGLTPELMTPVIGAAGANTSISMNTSQTWPAANLVALCQATGGKSLSLDFNGAQTTPVLLTPVIGAAGANTSVSMNTSQTWPAANLVALCQATGSKTLSLDFNGVQIEVSQIQTTISAAGASTTVSINTAQSISVNDLISVVRAAG